MVLVGKHVKEEGEANEGMQFVYKHGLPLSPRPRNQHSHSKRLHVLSRAGGCEEECS